eukprot:gene8235-1501_t
MLTVTNSPTTTFCEPSLGTERALESSNDPHPHVDLGAQDRCHDSLAEGVPHEIAILIISQLSDRDFLRASMTTMALHGFNFLRNPWFLEARNGLRGDVTDDLSGMEDRNPWNTFDGEHSPATWKRAGWIPNRAGGDGFVWECPPHGLSSVTCHAATPARGPPASLPYPPGVAPSRRSSGPKGLSETAGGLAQWVKEHMLRGIEAAVASAVVAMTSDVQVSAESEAIAEAAQVLGVSGCIATSSEWTELIQVVDLCEELQRRGLCKTQAEEMLNSGASLGFSIMVAGHSDCEGQFAVGLMLDEGTGDARQASQQFVMSHCRCHHYSGRLKTGEEAAGQWQRYAILIDKCPVGFRRAIIVLRGKDRGQRDGFYGVKFGSAELRFVAPTGKVEFGAAESEELWSGRKLNEWR